MRRGNLQTDFPSSEAGKRAYYALRSMSTRGEKRPWSEVCAATLRRRRGSATAFESRSRKDEVMRMAAKPALESCYRVCPIARLATACLPSETASRGNAGCGYCDSHLADRRAASMNKRQVTDGVAKHVVWWVAQRRSKLTKLSHESMAVNPFLAPLIMGLGDIKTFGGLADFLLAGHFGIGHATGFGKLVDEKILPDVFGTKKLNKAFRKTSPYTRSCFNEIDHLGHRPTWRRLPPRP